MHAKKCCSRRFGAFPSYLEHFYHCLLLNSLYKFVSFVFLTVSDEEGGQRQPSVRHRDANADLVKLARVSITEYHNITLNRLVSPISVDRLRRIIHAYLGGGYEI